MLIPTTIVQSNNAAFSDFTPTLTASSSNPTLGSGSVAKSRYIQIGELVIYMGEIVFGSSGVNAGSGQYRLSLPVALDTSRTDLIGTAQGFDSSTSTASVAGIYVLTATTVVLRSHAATSLWTEAVPWAWAASDRIDFFMLYEMA